MMMMMRYLLVLVAIFAVSLLTTTMGQPEQPGQQIALTREIVEDLLRVLSAECRSELESAIESQAMDISVNCKMEIQKNLLDMGHIPNSPPASHEGETFEDMYQDGEPSPRAAPSSKTETKRLVNPVVGIIVFVIILFAGAAYAVAQISPKVVYKEPKKLSRKKVH
jgi:uncharacterized membrane protein YgcG